MGAHPNITASKYPKQSDDFERRVKVCYHYDTSFTIGGMIIRDDVEAPHVCMIKTDDGRYLLATECMYSFE